MSVMNNSELTLNNGICRCCGGLLNRLLLKHMSPDRFEIACGVGARGYERLWMECDECGAATNILNDDCLKKLNSLSDSYYEVDYQGADISSKYDWVMSLPENNSDNAGRARRVDALFNNWISVKDATTGARILDIGAGTGVFLSRFLSISDVTWDAVAVEPDPNAAKHLRALNKFFVEEGFFTGAEQFGLFDLITLNKVLEHVIEPLDLLRCSAAALKSKSGALYVEVPDVKTIDYKPPTDNILGALHRHLYTPKSLEMMFEKVGLVTVQAARVIDPSGKITVYGFALHPETYSNAVKGHP